jgi:predicted esterase
MKRIGDWLNDIPGPHRGQEIILQGAPLDEARTAVVMVHGRGATASGILDLAGLLQGDELVYLAPQAAGQTWYPYSFLEAREANEPGLSSAQAALAAIIERLGGHGFGLERVVLLGFSQGACLAADYATRNPARYGGVAGLSGGLIGDEVAPDDFDGSLDGTLVYLGCSDVDMHIPVERVHLTATIMEQLGARVTKDIFPGMGHTVNHEEIEQVQAILDELAANATPPS